MLLQEQINEASYLVSNIHTRNALILRRDFYDKIISEINMIAGIKGNKPPLTHLKMLSVDNVGLINVYVTAHEHAAEFAFANIVY